MNNFPFQIIDLSHTLTKDIPSWHSHCGFNIHSTLDYDACESEVKFRVQSLSMEAGIGTHIDAPAHCIPGAATVEKISLNTLIAPCIVIDISAYAEEEYSFSVSDIQAWQHQYGDIPPKSFVLIRTGWDQYWYQPTRYHNQHRFPSVSIMAAQYLLQWDIVGLGIDTLSPDRPADGYPVHQLLLSQGKYIIENVANSAALPAKGSYICALPIKIEDATEAPVRLIGLINLA